MIAPPPATAWHFDDGDGRPLCGYVAAARITEPLERGRLIFASRAGCCPDCWQEFWTGRLERPRYWYEEDHDMATAEKPRRKRRAAKARKPKAPPIENGAQSIPPDIPPGLTSTTTPAGIAAHDPGARRQAWLATLPLAALVRHPANRHPSAEAITECAASLATTGQLEPIVVRLLRRHTVSPDDGQHVSEQYQIISGETRYLAAQRLGWERVTVSLIDCSDVEALRLVAEYNSHRTDLDPIQRARLIEQLCLPIAEGGGGLTREQAARSVGLESASAASNLVRLLTLPEHWQQRIAAGELPQTWARALLAIAEDDQALAQADQVWHQWRTRDDVVAFVERCCDAPAPSPTPREDFPETAEAAAATGDVEDGDGDAPTQPSGISVPAASDADDDGDGEEVPDDGPDEEPAASAASAEPVAISERLRGAVEEWRTRWLCQLVHDALPDYAFASDLLFTWLASLRHGKPQLGTDRSYFGFDFQEVWRLTAGLGSYASPSDCWETIANHNEDWLGSHKVQVCQAFLAGCRDVGAPAGISEHLVVVLGDLAHLIGLRLKDCWRRLQVCGIQDEAEENEQRLQAFYMRHTAGELADLGHMVGVDCTHHRSKAERIKVLLGVEIPVPPYLRDWSS